MALVLKDEKIIEEGSWFGLPNDPEVRFLIKPVTQLEIRAMRRKYTSTVFHPQTHQKVEVEDPEKKREVTEEVLLKSVLNWEGLYEVRGGKNKGIEFSQENLKKVLSRIGNLEVERVYNEETGQREKVSLSAWITDMALNAEKFIEGDQNLESTSGPGKISGGTGETENQNTSEG